MRSGEARGRHGSSSRLGVMRASSIVNRRSTARRSMRVQAARAAISDRRFAMSPMRRSDRYWRSGHSVRTPPCRADCRVSGCRRGQSAARPRGPPREGTLRRNATLVCSFRLAQTDPDAISHRLAGRLVIPTRAVRVRLEQDRGSPQLLRLAFSPLTVAPRSRILRRRAGRDPPCSWEPPPGCGGSANSTVLATPTLGLAGTAGQAVVPDSGRPGPDPVGPESGSTDRRRGRIGPAAARIPDPSVHRAMFFSRSIPGAPSQEVH